MQARGQARLGLIASAFTTVFAAGPTLPRRGSTWLDVSGALVDKITPAVWRISLQQNAYLRRRLE
jgi:hypothetical protein